MVELTKISKGKSIKALGEVNTSTLDHVSFMMHSQFSHNRLTDCKCYWREKTLAKWLGPRQKLQPLMLFLKPV